MDVAKIIVIAKGPQILRCPSAGPVLLLLSVLKNYAGSFYYCMAMIHSYFAGKFYLDRLGSSLKQLSSLKLAVCKTRGTLRTANT